MSRTPVSVLYGGAHLYKPETPAKMGAIALAVLDRYAIDLDSFGVLTATETLTPALRETVYLRVRQKLEREPVEDLRIDFEDGYGIRSGAEEDTHAESAAKALLETTHPPPFYGIRIKAEPARAQRTLDRFFAALGSRTISVTLPKVTCAEEVARFSAMTERYAARLELMVETRQALTHIAAFAAAAGPRLDSLHFGAYDFLSQLNVAADAQSLAHPLCDTARHRLVVESPVRVVDGATHQLPVGDHVVAHMRLHAANIAHALDTGITQGWDLHPAQLVARYATVYAYYLRSRDAAAARLQRFVKDAAKARVEGGIFDDAATAHGLINFFLRGVDSGALDANDLKAAGVDIETLRQRSFDALVEKSR